MLNGATISRVYYGHPAGKEEHKVAPLIANLDFAALLADRAFDIDGLRAELGKRGALTVIPPKSNRKVPIACDFAVYGWNHLTENVFLFKS